MDADGLQWGERVFYVGNAAQGIPFNAKDQFVDEVLNKVDGLSSEQRLALAVRANELLDRWGAPDPTACPYWIECDHVIEQDDVDRVARSEPAVLAGDFLLERWGGIYVDGRPMPWYLHREPIGYSELISPTESETPCYVVYLPLLVSGPVRVQDAPLPEDGR